MDFNDFKNRLLSESQDKINYLFYEDEINEMNSFNDFFELFKKKSEENYENYVSGVMLAEYNERM